MSGKNLFVKCLLGLSTIAFIFYFLTFGYEEGTMHFEVIGKIASTVIRFLSFPSIIVWDFMTNYAELGMWYYLALIINILLYSYCIYQVVNFILRLWK